MELQNRLDKTARDCRTYHQTKFHVCAIKVAPNVREFEDAYGAKCLSNILFRMTLKRENKLDKIANLCPT